MAAGDFYNNMWEKVKEHLGVSRHERIMLGNLTAFSTRIELLMTLWLNSDGSDASKELLYDGFDEEHEKLRAYVKENREDIVKLLPGLEEPLKEYFATNPYKNDDMECDEHREFAYDQKNDFCNCN